MALVVKYAKYIWNCFNRIFLSYKTKYPNHILPSENKKLIVSNISDCLLIRHFSEKSNVPVLDGPKNYINQAYIIHPSSNISDLSTNLLGIFGYEEGKIKIVGNKLHYFNTYCQPDFKPEIPIYREDYQIEDERKFWHLMVKDIESLHIEYNSENKNSKSFLAECKVLHTPMRWNYWHFSIRWLITEADRTPFFLNDLPPNQQKRYFRKIASETRSIISMKARVDNNFTYRKIKESEYLKKAL